MKQLRVRRGAKLEREMCEQCEVGLRGGRGRDTERVGIIT